MGISEFRKIKDEYIQSTSISQIKPFIGKNTEVKIYVDGSFYMYTGFIHSNLNYSGTSYCSLRVAETACTLIYNSIKKIEKCKIKICEVHIFFDGIKPGSKRKTMTLRKSKIGPIKNIVEVMNYMIELLNDHNYIINNLIIGEAEHEMTIHRDVKYPSILLSDDSDLFHISYNYNSITYNDHIFIGTKLFNCVYDIDLIYKDDFKCMPKLIFTLLCSLKGCDYTHNLFTCTMFKTIIRLYVTQISNNYKVEQIKKNINKFINGFKSKEARVIKQLQNTKMMIYNNVDMSEINTIEGIYTIDDICWCIKQLLKLLMYSNMSFIWNVNNKAKKYTGTHINNIRDQLRALTWFVNYSFIGCMYDKYLEVIDYPTDLDPFKFYHCILNCNSDVYNKVDTINFTNVDRSYFIKAVKQGIYHE